MTPPNDLAMVLVRKNADCTIVLFYSLKLDSAVVGVRCAVRATFESLNFTSDLYCAYSMIFGCFIDSKHFVGHQLLVTRQARRKIFRKRFL